VYPYESKGLGGKEIINEIPAGEDAIILLRRTDAKCSYSMSSSVYPRQKSEEELVEIAKTEGQLK